ncbi:hypothetical protein [Nostoc sp. MG11]|uniref:hypothetical protein n=1 Tax=Nostoc sp. MG11 TaxID=2721166 RepID=UPI001D007BEF|nr:hypothetical protein [Nostoc sp. MG11]
MKLLNRQLLYKCDRFLLLYQSCDRCLLQFHSLHLKNPTVRAGGSINAYVTKVPTGFLQIDGLMDKQGCYYVAVPQLVDVEFVPPF